MLFILNVFIKFHHWCFYTGVSCTITFILSPKTTISHILLQQHSIFKVKVWFKILSDAKRERDSKNIYSLHIGKLTIFTKWLLASIMKTAYYNCVDIVNILMVVNNFQIGYWCSSKTKLENLVIFLAILKFVKFLQTYLVELLS